MKSRQVPSDLLIVFCLEIICCSKHVSTRLSLHYFLFQGKTPRDRAQQAGDPDLASYLESRQNYQMVSHEDLETAVWCLEMSRRIPGNLETAPEALGHRVRKKLMESTCLSLSRKIPEDMPPVSKGYWVLPRNGYVPWVSPWWMRWDTQRSVESIGHKNLPLLLPASSMNFSHVHLYNLFKKKERKRKEQRGCGEQNSELTGTLSHPTRPSSILTVSCIAFILLLPSLLIT